MSLSFVERSGLFIFLALKRPLPESVCVRLNERMSAISTEVRLIQELAILFPPPPIYDDGLTSRRDEAIGFVLYNLSRQLYDNGIDLHSNWHIHRSRRHQVH